MKESSLLIPLLHPLADAGYSGASLSHKPQATSKTRSRDASDGNPLAHLLPPPSGMGRLALLGARLELGAGRRSPILLCVTQDRRCRVCDTSTLGPRAQGRYCNGGEVVLLVRFRLRLGSKRLGGDGRLPDSEAVSEHDGKMAPQILTIGGGPGTSGMTKTSSSRTGRECESLDWGLCWRADASSSQPIGVGFSYGNMVNSSRAAALDAYDFLQKFFRIESVFALVPYRFLRLFAFGRGQLETRTPPRVPLGTSTRGATCMSTTGICRELLPRCLDAIRFAQ